MLKSLDVQLWDWNKMLCNFYNPKKTTEIKYLDNRNIMIKLYVRKTSQILDNNFREFFRDKKNGRYLGSVVKKLIKDYSFEPCRGTSFKGFYNPENWKRIETDLIEYSYYMTKR